jgi:ATP-dependent helicase/nuclease subunit A
VVIEACAGSGKTWLLVSRIIRLLLDGATPSQILAITFTRKAAQEMATRLREWLRELATADDGKAREFLRQREVPENEIAAALPRARALFEELLTHQPSITISTFHSWFLQILRRAPLDAGALGEVNLVEQTSSLVDEAWQLFASRVQREPGSPAARGLDRLFRDCGLSNTQRVLTNFLYRRAEWWAYTHGQADPIGYALERIENDMRVGPDEDVAGQLYADAAFCSELAEYARLLERSAARPEQENARLGCQLQACEGASADERLRAACSALLRADGEPRKDTIRSARRLDVKAARFLELHARVAERVREARRNVIDQESYRYNEAALHCGTALLEAYRRVKEERLVIDYDDIEWHAWRLVSVSEHATYMQFKLDARYRHILLDEFQDTNPLQWLTLKSWLEAAVAADMRPTVFMVGDPKQSIYRFRRAEARLFGMAGTYLEEQFAAEKVPQHETRRCPQPVIDVVNRLFGDAELAFEGFEQHAVHYTGKPGRVEVLPLVKADPVLEAQPTDAAALRNPLEAPLTDVEDSRRRREADLLVAKIREIRGTWRIADMEGREFRAAEYRDVMLLVRRRTHLATYERALRIAQIPFVTSRYGGLLDTLEAKDIVALLEFLVSPFADLKLAHALRSPVFGCTDEDLKALAAAGGENHEGTWWERLCRVVAGGGSGDGGAALTRAHALLARWLARTDSAPVHDQLDRIYFEADVVDRYQQAVPEVMRGAVRANLQAFMQRALDTDSGRYPSLPRFLHELMDLREAPAQEAPDEGIVGDAGNAVRIYTIHGAKGLESPVVWLLDAASPPDSDRGYDALVDWPPADEAPCRFSLTTVKAGLSAAQQAVMDGENRLEEREELNLLYVAITRARQAFILSGSEIRNRKPGLWYEKVRCATLAASGRADDPAATAVHGDDLSAADAAPGEESQAEAPAIPIDPRLNAPLPTGERRNVLAGRGLTYGTHFHLLMERLTGGGPADREAVRTQLALSERDFAPMWDQAQGLIAAPRLARFFDSRQFRRALNEVAYTAEAGELRRIDRLVEFEHEVWVLDYKTGESPGDVTLAEQYRAQLGEYCAAVRTIYPGKAVRGLLVFSGGEVMEA